jgi:translation initiation factor IF-2
MTAAPATAAPVSAPLPPAPALRTTYVPGAPRASAPRGSGAVRPTGAQVIGHVDLGRLRPTATQAVVLSRPLIQVKRVTPSSQAHKGFPMAPGRKAIGEVKEFKVVPDHLGRGKELVDVTKKQAGRGRGKVA